MSFANIPLEFFQNLIDVFTYILAHALLYHQKFLLLSLNVWEHISNVYRLMQYHPTSWYACYRRRMSVLEKGEISTIITILWNVVIDLCGVSVNYFLIFHGSCDLLKKDARKQKLVPRSLRNKWVKDLLKKRYCALNRDMVSHLYIYLESVAKQQNHITRTLGLSEEIWFLCFLLAMQAICIFYCRYHMLFVCS
jgi:hypothetical protein